MRLTRSLARASALAAVAVLTTALAATAEIPDDDALPDDAVAAERLAGVNRYQTAQDIANEAYPDGADTVIIARGDAFPDGLAASYLAGVEDAPILLTQPNALTLETQDAMDDLQPERAIIVGGPTAIDQNVEDALVAYLGGADRVRRIEGNDRFFTAAVISNEGAAGTLSDLSGDSTDELRTAIVASGRNFPDALAAGPLAHAGNLPILLTEPDRLPDITALALENRDIQQVIVAGGPVTISEAVLDQIAGIGGVEVVQRVSGADRTATAVELADLAREQLGWPAENTAVALGTDFPDALSLAPAASGMQAPILLTRASDHVGAPTFAALQATCDTAGRLAIAGGETAVDATTERQAELATSCADHAVELTSEAVVADGETGAGDPEASGNAWIWTESLCYAVRAQDLSSPATDAALRSGGAGTNGGVVAALDTPQPTTGDGLAVGCLTADDIQDGTPDDLRSALQEEPESFYVDVRSEDHPDGALRGQVADAPADEA